MSNLQPMGKGGPARRTSAVRPVSDYQERTERDQMNWWDRYLDRELASGHVVQVRETRRGAERLANEAIAAAAVATAAIEAKRQYLYKVKQQLALARQESEMLARGDVALMANFSHLDEDLYRTARMYGMDLDL